MAPHFSKSAISYLLILFVFAPMGLLGNPANRAPDKNLVTMEYLPFWASIAARGGGAGFGYERRINDFLAVQVLIGAGGVPAENGGSILFGALSGDAVFSPFPKARSLKLSTGVGILYFGAVGEERQGSLEAHFFIPSVHGSIGWRFSFGKRKVSFILEPQLAAALIFPGPTGSGPAGELEWYSTGYWMAMIYPNLSLGVSF
ncbi:MAG: hypothetical protein JXR86_17595 [Spirochaetales bacterium]|nr:hypothetical protein [Spirochaetales bacterium]